MEKKTQMVEMKLYLTFKVPALVDPYGDVCNAEWDRIYETIDCGIEGLILDKMRGEITDTEWK